MVKTLHRVSWDTDIGSTGHNNLLRHGRLVWTAEHPYCSEKETGSFDWQRRPISLGPDGSKMSHNLEVGKNLVWLLTAS